MTRPGIVIAWGMTAVMLLASGGSAGAEEAPRPTVARGTLLRALTQLEDRPALAAQARALAAASAALERAGDTLWQELLAQRGDADHAFRWTPATRAEIEAAIERFRTAKQIFVTRTEALAAAAAGDATLQARASLCAAEQADCTRAWEAFTCAPLLPVCLASGI